MIIPSNIKAIIFDYDGVLGDSDTFNTYACKESAKLCGIELEEIVYRQCAPGGATIHDIATCIVTHYGKPELVEKYIEYKRSFDKQYGEEVEILSNVESTIKYLSDKYILAVNTGTRKILVGSFLSKFGLEKYFQTIVSSEDITRGKPSPESYLLTCSQIGVSTRDSLVVEDGSSGVISAKKAGCYVVGITNSLSNSHLKELGCDKIISDLSELTVPTAA